MSDTIKLADIEDVIAAAKRHGENSETDHEVGDLQDALRLAWKFMRHEAQRDFMTHSTIWDIVKENPPEFEPTPWEPAVYSDSMFYLVRRVATGPEAKCDGNGRIELFHTRFNALDRANALNRED